MKTRFWKPSQAQFDEPRSPPWSCAVARPRHRAVKFHILSHSLGPLPRKLHRDAYLSPCPCNPPAGSINQVWAVPAWDRALLQPRESATKPRFAGTACCHWPVLPRSLARGPRSPEYQELESSVYIGMKILEREAP